VGNNSPRDIYGDRILMAEPTVAALKARIAQLERQVAELTERLAAYERSNQPRQENPVDSKTVREKVRFDWQS
jgi:uncharacterized protein involved in exopolysaccharide biosynthesis